MREVVVGVVLAILVVLGCGAPQGTNDGDDVPPFELRPVAWMIFLDEHPELRKAGDGSSSKTLDGALRAFHGVVNDRREVRDAKQKTERRQSCRQAWNKLTAEMQRSKEIKGHLLLARSYVGVECGLAQKSLPDLRRVEKGSRQADPLFYESHFWHAESLLELDRGTEAIGEYRWILGELEAPLYPLALLRTAHCHWDANEQDQAREYLGHVRDWLGDKTGPRWVLSLKKQVGDDLRRFSR